MPDTELERMIREAVGFSMKEIKREFVPRANVNQAIAEINRLQTYKIAPGEPKLVTLDEVLDILYEKVLKAQDY